MWSLLKRIFKHLLVVAGVLVILLAMGLGAFRLLIAQLPSYQSELQALVADKVGMAIAFEQLDGRWSFGGPEFTLRDVSLGAAGESETFLRATRAFVAFDPWTLVLDRELVVRELRLDGVRLVAERGVDGALRMQGLPVGSAVARDLADLVPSEIVVVVRDSQLLYIDRSRRRSWQFVDVSLSMARADERVEIDVRAAPPAELAGRADLRLSAVPKGASGRLLWQVSANLERADLAGLAELLPAELPFTAGGTGDASVDFEWDEDRIARVAATLDFNDVAVPGAGSAPLDRARFGLEWRRSAAAGWHLDLEDVELVRDDARWLVGGRTAIDVEQARGNVRRAQLTSDFLDLGDFADLVPLVPESHFRSRWLALEPRGALEAIDVTFELVDDEWDYSLDGQFVDVAFAPDSGYPGLSGLSGTVRAGGRSGTVVLDSRDMRFEWPGVFRAPVATSELSGTVLWREGRDGVRVVSNDLAVGLLGERAESSFELTLPLDGSSPLLDLDTEMRATDLVAAKSLLPVGVMPESVVAWIDSAVRAGSAHDIELDFFGPLAAFPFDDGNGQFRVTAEITDAELAFVADWPSARDLDGSVEFHNASFVGLGSGRVLGNESRDIAVAVPDMRDPVLTVSAETDGTLADVIAFLRGAPLIAASLGSGYDRVHAHAGRASVDLNLQLPLLEMSAFGLEAQLTVADAEISVDGFAPHATEINGRLGVAGTSVSGVGIEGVMFDGPVVARVTPGAAAGYRAELYLDGETSIDAVLDEFDLPFEDLVAGPTRWQGRLSLPAAGADEAAPFSIEVQSNLSGVALHFPAPLAKAPAEPSNLQLAFLFDGQGGLDVRGNIGATRRFALDYDSREPGFAFRRGAVRFGGEDPELPDRDGIAISGRIPQLDFSDWLALGKSSSIERAQPLFLSADLELSEFRAFGQQLGTTRLIVDRGDEDWRIDLDSEAIAGRVTVPRPLTPQSRIVAEMQRVYLATNDEEVVGARSTVDPRTLPGLSLSAEEFGFGSRELGAVEAEINPDPLGLRLVSFTSRSASYSAEGSGSWLRNPGGETTRFAATIESTDVGATLDALGIGAVLEGESAELSASVYWTGGPSGRWLDHLNGDVALRVDEGSLVDVDPGAGRVVGLMSIAALPRRLALDFRDVFNKGFAFDEISGDFTIIDGNAYTNNLKMAGPGAEIGVVGRTGLRDRDYQQQAVVTAEPGNMLPTVGGLLGGPGVGAALFVFTRLFKEPLKGIGRASYCVTGRWDSPEVERMSGDEIEAERCAVLPEAMLTAESER